MAYTPNFYQPVFGGGYAPLSAEQLQQMRTPPFQRGFNPVGAPAAPETPPIIWVQGIEGAKAYFVAPNCTVQLWDAERQTIYLKSADASGVPSVRVLDWTERSAAQPVNNVEYATKQEVEELKGLINSLIMPTAKEGNNNG